MKTKRYRTAAERLRAHLNRAEYLAKRGLLSEDEVQDVGHRLEEEDRERWLDEVEGFDREPDPDQAKRDQLLAKFRAELARWAK